MRILLIGGTAFIGRHLVARLVEAGHDVTVLHRKATHDLGPRVHNLQADRHDLDALARAIGSHNWDAVVDTAYDWARGTTADEVAAAARRVNDGVRRYVFMSSVAAYGGGLDRIESDPLAEDNHPNPYVVHKATAERALFRIHDENGLPVTTFRPPFVYGEHQPFYREAFFWDRLLDGRPIILPDGGEAPMQWVWVRDLVDACVRALEQDAARGEAFNVAHTETLTQRRFVEALARVAGVEPRFAPMPRQAIHEAGGHPFAGNLYFGEYLDIPPITTRIEKVTRLLGWQPTPLDEGLRAAYEWYRTQPRRAVDYAFEDALVTAR